MTLTRIQRRVLELIHDKRSPDSYVAGGAALNRSRPRLSDDIDIFHSPEVGLRTMADADINVLRENHFRVVIYSETDLIIDATVKVFEGEETNIQWSREMTWRFFPAQPDPEFGYVLHPVDNAINKIICAATRGAERDMVDLCFIARELPLGPLFWAAPGKDGRLPNPSRLLREARRNLRAASTDAIATLRADPAFDPGAIKGEAGRALDRAAIYVERDAPDESPGRLFVDPHQDRPVEATNRQLATGLARALDCHERGVIVRLP